MSWKRLFCFMSIGLMVFGVSSLALASTVDKSMEISVQASIDEVNCQHTPQTIMVLGLPIDVSGATFGTAGETGSLTCWDLSGGLNVIVKLTGDITEGITSLTATEVEVEDTKTAAFKINAHLQAVDTSATTVSVLGLTVDIGTAAIVNDANRPVAANQLKADQFVRLTLASDNDPLTATRAQVSVNQASVQAPIDAVDCAGSPATITMLGVKLDVGKAIIGPKRHHKNMTCTDIHAGQVADAYLASDIPDAATGLLTAAQVVIREGWWGTGTACNHREAKINAPLQAIDTTADTVTVIGLVIDLKNAYLFNEKLDSIRLSQLKVGQSSKITLDADSLAAGRLLAHVDEIKLKAPITALDCSGSSQTITMLGLTIDVTDASFGSKWNWHWGHGKRGWYHGELTCADLKVGQTVVAELSGDISNGLPTAMEVEVRGDHDGDVLVSAPLDAIDTSAHTVTLLGLTVDVSAAKLRDDNGNTITLDQLTQDQFVDIDLTSDKTPLLAASLVARTGTNQLHIKVFDEKGKAVTNSTVKAVITVKNGKSVVIREATGTGSLILTSIPAGQVKVAITRVNNGKTSKASASVAMKSNTNKLISARLKTVK
jgi:hypothetical protein